MIIKIIIVLSWKNLTFITQHDNDFKNKLRIKYLIPKLLLLYPLQV